MTSHRPHLALMVTSSMATIFFRGQIARLREDGFRVTFICSPGPQTAAIVAEGAELITIPMERDVAPFSDLLSLWRLRRTLRRIRPDITNVGTPKAGLLGGIAARLAGVPCRVYTLHGLRVETATGWKRFVLSLAERVACFNAHYVRFVSPSLRKKAIELGVLSPRKALVVGAGSSNGVDCERFRSTSAKIAAAADIRHSLGIPAEAPVIGFVGRLTRDKGLAELWGAYRSLKPSFPALHLLLLGDYEDGDPVDPGIRAELVADPNVHLLGTVADAAPYYPLMTVVALPTYREGFPNVPLEAGAAAIPVVTTNATGAVDSVVDGVTGRLVPVKDTSSLAEALQQLILDGEQRRTIGRAAEQWVNENFTREKLWAALITFYRDVLQGAAGETTATIEAPPAPANQLRGNVVPTTKRTRLLIVATVHDFLEAFLLPFARHYRGQGWTVDALARDAAGSELCRAAFDTVHDASWSRSPLDLPGNLRGAAHLREMVREGKYDLVHVHTPVASFVTRAALRHARPDPRVIYTAHGFHFFPGAPWHNNILYRRLEQVAGRWTDALVVLNRDDEAAARKYHIVDDERLFYMPGIGIDLHQYSQEAVSADQLGRIRQELGIGPGEPVLLQVAEMIPRKRHEDTLRAFAKTDRRARLLLAGDGPLRSELESLAVSLGINNRVVFLGQRRDVPALVRLADALVLPSSQEGLPRSVMEAMAMSQPVIGSDIRGTRDLLVHGGGKLVPVGDIDAIAKAMTAILENPKQALEMGMRGRESVQVYDLRYILKLHDELYDRILSRSRTEHRNASAQVAF